LSMPLRNVHPEHMHATPWPLLSRPPGRGLWIEAIFRPGNHFPARRSVEFEGSSS